jgi:hypothetical protein
MLDEYSPYVPSGSQLTLWCFKDVLHSFPFEANALAGAVSAQTNSEKDFTSMQTQEGGHTETETVTHSSPVNDSAQVHRGTIQQSAILACAGGLLVCFFVPWVSSGFATKLSGAALARGQGAWFYWSIPILAVATIGCLRQPQWRSWIALLTFIATWVVVQHASFKLASAGVTDFRYGFTLTSLFSLGLLLVAAQQRSNAADFVARKLNARKADVFAHWGTVIPGVQFRVQEFYARLEKIIAAKKWPGVAMLRITHTEAGVLSHQREYLRVVRQRQVFDICCASYGVDGFFSLREAEIPAVVDVRSLLVIMILLLTLAGWSIGLFGFVLGPMALLLFLIVAAWFLFNVLKMGLTKVDSLLVRLPAIGPVYEAWFRKDTYFQQDTRILFLQMVNDLVKRLVEETTSSEGVKLLKVFEHQPILDGLYKTSQVNVAESK